MTTTQSLNQRFGAALGCPNGIDPRFAWMHSSEVFYSTRGNLLHGWERHPWLTKLGDCWVLCQWRSPEMSETDWILTYGMLPYPDKGRWTPFAETALPAGMEPTAELTDGYINGIRQQLERAEFASKENYAGRKDPTTEQCERDAQKSVDEQEQQFFDAIGDWEPLSWKLGEPREPGDHDGAVAYQVGGSRDEIPATT